MNNTTLSRWRSRLGYTQQQAADAMGVERRTYQALEHESERNTGAPLAPSKRTRLAAAAIEAGIRPIGEE